MRALLGLLSLLLLAQGIGGLMNNLLDDTGRSWFLVNYIDFLDGYRVYASIAVIMLGLAVAAASESLRKRSRHDG